MSGPVSVRSDSLLLCEDQGRRHRECLGELGTPRLVKYPLRHPPASLDFNIRCNILMVWYRPSQNSHWLPHAHHLTSLAPAFKFLWQRP